MGVSHPLDRLLVVVQCPKFDLNSVDRPAPLCDQIEGRCGKKGTETEKPAEAKAWAAIASAVCPFSCPGVAAVVARVRIQVRRL